MDARIPDLEVIDLHRVPYRDAGRIQVARRDALIAARQAGRLDERDTLFLVEHDPPVITVSRRPGAADHITASPETLDRLGIQVEPTDRGGDITYHGPGQLVAYPILDLNRLRLGLHQYVRLLEGIVIAVLDDFGVPALRDPDATGVWVPLDAAGRPTEDRPAVTAKICAIGIRVSRWVTLHGLALNVTTNLSHFATIVPCGLVGRPVTSLHALLGDRAPDMPAVKQCLVRHFRIALTDPSACIHRRSAAFSSAAVGPGEPRS